MSSIETDTHTKGTPMQYRTWQHDCSSGLAPLQRSILGEEARTRLIRDWQPEVIIGLLRTEPYARAILRACIDVLGIPSDLETVVATRMQRQQILTQDGHEFRFLIGEWVLYRTVDTHDVMTEQLEHLVNAADNPRLSLGIVPMDARFLAPTTGFLIHDDTKASTEAVGGEIIVTEPEGIALHAKTFDILTRQAVFGNAARQLIEAAAETHRSGHRPRRIETKP
ncbi:XRE family transcriptional regulator [Nocardia seriolae]|nr:DUF5753 domain-containing protein [Nocardia seriolae]MTJ66863.1 XRE family transcriptional regulator [Nocardia seriolae]MTJ72520.1 XRE family transcriptional regulator [Nocardia seriolae]MTJ84846.1 XRE family transcriptional regulator [Nocardia seriolae]MTK28842.1 XRE family transcriptional regulator [Nocardia seriolae]MTK44971.1 XRE family transcriptional regulator [Nocardia seriolae]